MVFQILLKKQLTARPRSIILQLTALLVLLLTCCCGNLNFQPNTHVVSQQAYSNEVPNQRWSRGPVSNEISDLCEISDILIIIIGVYCRLIVVCCRLVVHTDVIIDTRVARSKWTKYAKPLVKKCQIASKNAKQAETGQMLLVLTFPDE